MKIKYLILAHGNFRFLDELVSELDGPDVEVFIHIDKKVKKNYENSLGNVSTLETRFVVNWGGYGMIRATLQLMKVAFESDPSSKARFVLISGADFPIRPRDFITKVYDTNFEYINISPAPLSHKPMKRFENIYFDLDRKRSRKLTTLIGRMSEFIIRKLGIRRKPHMQIYVGSQWFALTAECVAFILEEVKGNIRSYNFFKHVYIPDEAFFQTIIGNSRFMENVRNNLTYADWSTSPAPAMITNRHIKIFE